MSVVAWGGEEEEDEHTLSKCDCGYFFNFGERIGGDLSRVDIIFGKRSFSANRLFQFD